MEEKTYTLTEKELFDLLESEVNAAIGGTSMRAMVDYHADRGMGEVFGKAFSCMLSIDLTPTTEEISDAFHKYRNEKGKDE